MPPTPEKNPLEDIDLDFTKPQDKLKDLEEKIAATKRGIVLALSINDEGRVLDLERKLQDFETTKQILEAGQEKSKMQEEDIDAFSQAVGAADRGAVNKMEKRGF